MSKADKTAKLQCFYTGICTYFSTDMCTFGIRNVAINQSVRSFVCCAVRKVSNVVVVSFVGRRDVATLQRRRNFERGGWRRATQRVERSSYGRQGGRRSSEVPVNDVLYLFWVRQMGTSGLDLNVGCRFCIDAATLTRCEH